MKNNKKYLKNDDLLLEVKKISKNFPGTKALDEVNLSVYKGKVTSLMGENGAGKSTIMNILFGIHSPSSGKIIFNGKEIKIKSPSKAMDFGISMVHQELNQHLEGTVYENIWMGRYPKGFIFVKKNKMILDTKKVLQSLKINIDPKAKMKDLSVSERQMIEIAKAITYDSKIIILDEPTSSLTSGEVEHLFSIIKNIKNKNIGVLFVSHKMEEIFKISDYITVFRDGKYISQDRVQNYTEERIVKEMVGREMKNMYPPRAKPHSSKNILEVKKLSSKKANINNVNFSLKKGEILGIAGLVGSGRTEVLESIFGLIKKDKNSEIIFSDEKILKSSPKLSIKKGISLVTEERKKDGIFTGLDVKFNINASQFDFYKGPFKIFLRNNLMKADAEKIVDSLKIKTPNLKTSINSLSGGNQQKCVFGRWLLLSPKILLLDEPTRGIDVGAKYQIYEEIIKLSEAGTSFIIVSSEMQELIGICHRIAVMSNGEISGFLREKEMTQENIMFLASKNY